MSAISPEAGDPAGDAATGGVSSRDYAGPGQPGPAAFSGRFLAIAPVRCTTPRCDREFYALGESRCERCRHIAACVADARKQRAAVYWLDWAAGRADKRRMREARR